MVAIRRVMCQVNRYSTAATATEMTVPMTAISLASSLRAVKMGVTSRMDTST